MTRQTLAIDLSPIWGALASRRLLAAGLTALVLGMAQVPPAEAGCGCEKAPPDEASIRPNATFSGSDVRIFDDALQVGATYRVDFVSGTTNAVAGVDTVAVAQFDLADADRKLEDRELVTQLVVTLPELPLGPTAVRVTRVGQGAPLFEIEDDALTVVAQPLAMTAELGEYTLENVRGAVGRDGTVYIALDLLGITLPRVFRAQALGYPLRFRSKDLAFYNTQGFLMQLLNKKMPGLHSIETVTSSDSDILLYSRHEFATYFMQHGERALHQVSSDQNWHLDGSPHIDHDHLILAIAGELANGSMPVPGATPPLTFHVGTHSNFEQGIIAVNSVTLSNYSASASFDLGSVEVGEQGDLYSEKDIKVEHHAKVNGNVAAVEKAEVKDDGVVERDAEAYQIVENGRGRVNGTKKLRPARPVGLIEVEIPEGLEYLEKIELVDGATRTIVGPGSFEVDGIKITNGELIIDNSAGPVTLYCSDTVEVNDLGTVSVLDYTPEKFALYMKSGKNVKIRGDSTFHGLIYGPKSDVVLEGTGEFFGSIVAEKIEIKDDSRVYYDPQLR
jgi:cytoskeletal protein CcmA (bactofilin family)